MTTRPYPIVPYIRSMDVQNAECRAEYERRRMMQLNYADLRGDITGPLLDQDYANRIRLAKALLADIKKWPANVIPIKRKRFK